LAHGSTCRVLTERLRVQIPVRSRNSLGKKTEASLQQSIKHMYGPSSLEVAFSPRLTGCLLFVRTCVSWVLGVRKTRRHDKRKYMATQPAKNEWNIVGRKKGQPKRKRKTLCRFFNRRFPSETSPHGGCLAGADCEFRHEVICEKWRLDGVCRTDGCTFAHEFPVHNCKTYGCRNRTVKVYCTTCHRRRQLKTCKNPVCNELTRKPYCRDCYRNVLCKTCWAIPCICDTATPEDTQAKLSPPSAVAPPQPEDDPPPAVPVSNAFHLLQHGQSWADVAEAEAPDREPSPATSE